MLWNRKRLLCIFTLLMVFILLTSCTSQSVSLPDWVTKTEDTGDDTDWYVAQGETVVLSNGKIQLEMQTDTTHFAVTDLSTGEQFDSIPKTGNEIYSSETQARIASELSLVYYNEDSTALFMTSTNDSVQNGNFEVRQKGNTVRVYYTFGATTNLLVPKVLTKEVFEQVICGNGGLDSSRVRRITRYYDVYLASDKEAHSDFNDKVNQYPILAEKDLYILKDTVDQLKKMEISEDMGLANYTTADYTVLLNELGIEVGESNEAGFTIPVEYSLNEDGLTAKILMDKVKEFSSDYPLYQIDLLEYFASCGAEAEGYYLVPDGSGTLIRMNEKEGDYSQRLYGNDAAIQSSSKTQLSKSALLPIFGMTRGSTGLLGIIEESSEVSSLHVRTMSASNPQNTIYTSFAVRALDVTDIGADRNIPVYNLYSEHLLRESPQVRYVLLDQPEANYVGMAAYMRGYYLKNGKLPENQTKSSFFLDYVCLATQDASFLGVPYTQSIPLSTLESITDQLSSSELKDISVRLSGYSKDGITHGLYNDFELSSKVGSIQSLLGLNEYLKNQNGRLYVDADFQHVYKDKLNDSFSVKADTAQYLNRSIAVEKEYDRVTRAYFYSYLSNYLVSPTRYTDIASNFLKSLTNKVGENSGLGISYGSAGNLLLGDYSKKKDLDCTATTHWIEEILSTAKEQSYPIVTETGNSYVLPYVNQLLNAPLYSSGFDISTDTVPFYQLVVHGSVAYTGTAMNLSADSETNLLRSLEYGAGLYWKIMIADDYKLSETPYATMLYSMEATDNLEEAKELYNQLGDYLNSIDGVAMNNHEKLADQVYRTTYANGDWVIVNYSDNSIVMDGVTVAGRSYVVRY